MRKYTVKDSVFLCMRNNAWWTFWDLQRVIKEKTGTFYGEATISAAIRELRKPHCRIKYGIPMEGDPVMKRRIGSRVGYQYKLTNRGKYNGI